MITRPHLKSVTRWIAIVALIGVIAWSIGGGGRGGPKVGGAAPDFTVPTLAGVDFTLSQHRGKVVVLDFWATYCGPCKVSLPALQKVRAKYADSKDVFVGTVNTDRGPRRAVALKRWLEKRKLDFPVLLDDNRQTVSATYRVKAIPTMVVIGRDGKVSSVQVGLPAGDTGGIIEHIEAAIAEAMEAPQS